MAVSIIGRPALLRRPAGECKARRATLFVFFFSSTTCTTGAGARWPLPWRRARDEAPWNSRRSPTAIAASRVECATCAHLRPYSLLAPRRLQPGPVPPARELRRLTCPLQLEYPCKVNEAGAPGCFAARDAGTTIENQVPRGTSFPYGCTVIVPDPTPDESGQCSIRGTCRCGIEGDGGFAFACSE